MRYADLTFLFHHAPCLLQYDTEQQDPQDPPDLEPSMKTNTSCIAFTLMTLLAAGCTLEPVPDGIECPNMRYVSIDNRTKCVNADDCRQYPNIFDEAALKAIHFGLCPPDPSRFECKQNNEYESYCNYIDRSSEVICDNKPIEPSSSNDYCGARGNCNSDDEGSKDWRGEKCTGSSHCEKGKCVRESVCGEGTHPDMYNHCVADTSEDCGATHDNCETDGLLCYNGVCVDVCPQDTIECGAFESVRGICVDPNTNTAYCGAKPAQADGVCTEYAACGQNQTCTNGHCGCKLGYHEVNTGDNESYCVMDTKEECGNPETHEIENCYDIPNADVVYCHPNRGCVIQMCVDNYHLYEEENICEPDDPQNCGRHGVTCNVENAENSCVNRYCSFECHEGYIRNATNQFCISENTEACGTPPVNCTTRIDGWAAGTCQNGQCKVTNCQAGFHLYDNSCEANTNDHCGEHSVSCAVAHATNTCTQDGTCEFQCDEDYRKSTSGDSCVSNSTVTCGSNNVNCAETMEGWANGKCESDKCVASECINNYYVSGGKCVKSDNTHCGSATISCATTHGTGTCTNNKCKYVCDSGYHLTKTENACEQNTTDNCGSSGYKCSEKFPNWSQGTCSNDGECIVSECKGDNHVYKDGNTCEANTVSTCGSHDNACPTVSNGSYSCISGKCELSCKSNYHLSSDKKRCDPDSKTECGNLRINCPNQDGWEDGECINGSCVATSCNDYHYLSGGNCLTCDEGYHLNPSATGCEEDSEKACGKYKKDCTQLDGWKNGNCYQGHCNVTECYNGYILESESRYDTYMCYNSTNCSQFVDSFYMTYTCPLQTSEGDHICCEWLEDCAVLLNDYELPPTTEEVINNGCQPFF